MCGIVGYVGNNKSKIEVLIEGLKKLEYRGYDSAGIAYIKENDINIIKEEGKLVNLEEKVNKDDLSNLGIGHTRWATHGKADTINAHPHKVGKFTIVHNGIIENYGELKEELEKKGYVFKSSTDTEVACAVLDDLYKSDKDILSVINKASKILIGAYAFGIICEDDKENLYAARKNSPLIIGVGNNENYIASDVPAILEYANKYILLDNGDYAKINKDEIKLYNDGKEIKYEIKTFEYDKSSASKMGYSHFMLKEIHEEPEVFKNTVDSYLNTKDKVDITKYKGIKVLACGSATHASLVGKYLIQNYADIKVDVLTASEFRYEKLFLSKDDLVIVVSQSGETADTLEALKIANKNGNDTLGIINVKGSSIAREAKKVIYTEAKTEIAVATTKAYLSQVCVFMMMALDAGYKKGIISKAEKESILKEINELPVYMEELINRDYKDIAKILYDKEDIFFVGRQVDYAICMEGSLKLKEISYIHSEAYAAGELKHGTISLIEDNTPVIAVVTDDSIALKTISNIKEVKSRGANVIYLTNRENDVNDFYDVRIKVPKVNYLLEAMLTVIPLQLIAFETAKLKGCSIDKPKNLAKSVTVE